MVQQGHLKSTIWQFPLPTFGIGQELHGCFKRSYKIIRRIAGLDLQRSLLQLGVYADCSIPLSTILQCYEPAIDFIPSDHEANHFERGHEYAKLWSVARRGDHVIGRQSQ